MSKTLNYNYAVTEKFIRRIPAKPVSCIKLREQYKDISASLGCNCNFKLVKNSYPSPVLHALNDGTAETVTLPVSKSVELSENDKKVYEDKLNVPKQSEELINSMLELNKKKRVIEKEIKNCEEQLNQIFDSLKIDKLDVGIGVLVRTKNDKEIIWNIIL